MKLPIVNPQFQVNPETTVSIHDEGIVILHLGQGRLYRCNGTGARIWRGLEQHLPVDAIAGQVSREFHIAHAAAREHALRFLSQLERHSLIQRRAA
jgi:hypothetical protein